MSYFTISQEARSIEIPQQMLKHVNYLRGLDLEGPRLGNTFLEDSALREYTESIIGSNSKFQAQLTRLGDKFNTVYMQAARNAEQNPPRLQQFDTYGRRIDKLHLSQGWKTQKRLAAQDGILALAYGQDQYGLGDMQRFGQLVVYYMFHPSSAMFGGPLAMSDGAAFTIKKLLQSGNYSPDMRKRLEEAFARITSRSNMWISGQWMTEKKGGSDVSNTQTIAVFDEQSKMYRLYGYKWFTSGTDGNMSLCLAKILPKNIQPTIQNLKNIQVSLFFLKVRNEDDTLNNMEIVRLKDKMGTKQLPTAQMLLKGAYAHIVSQQQKGVKGMSKMLAITRTYNAATAVGLMRRGIALARDYACRRKIGSTQLADMPLQQRVLSNLQVIHRGNLMFYLKVAELFSKQQASTINDHDRNLVRILTPLAKLFTGKQVLVVLTQVLEAFGGMGYIQGSMLPTLLRDAQVLSIWQGTTNVMCYDFVRAIMKKQNAYWPLQSLAHHFNATFDTIKITTIKGQKDQKVFDTVFNTYQQLFKEIHQASQIKFKGYFGELRNFCFGISRIYIACELLRHYGKTQKIKDFQIAARWVQIGLYHRDQFDKDMDKELAMNLDEDGKAQGVGNVDARGIPRPRL